MILTPTPLPGSFVVEPKRFDDDRGFFSRPYGGRELAAALGVSDARPCVEANISFNHKRGTLRGMHYQSAPMDQPKLVRVTAGAIWDCIVDLRPASPTHRKWFGSELTARNYKALYIPPGFAHGFITLTDATEVLYTMYEYYSPDHSAGVRWNDPAFGIEWPIEPTVMHPRDAAYPDYRS